MRKFQKKRKINFKEILRFLFALVLILFVILYPLCIENKYYDKFIAVKKEDMYKGIITLYDTEHVSVRGSGYGFIKTLADKYEQINSGVKIEVNQMYFDDNFSIGTQKIHTKDDGADIIQTYYGSDKLYGGKIMKDAQLIEILKEKSDMFFTASQSELSIPVAYGCNCIIVNNQLLAEIGIELPKENLSKAEFLNFIDEVAKECEQRKLIPFDMDVSSSAYMPFLLDKGGYSSLDYDFIKLIKEKVRGGEEYFSSKKTRRSVNSDFFAGKTVILAGDMDQVNYIKRREGTDKGFEFEVYLYPGNISFINEIIGYSFIESDDKLKNKMLIDFARFLYDDESQSLVEVLGKVPVSKSKNAKVETYEYLNQFRNLKNYYSVTDKEYIDLKEDIQEEIKKIL